ncbi:hypothetical protein [Corynebacterium marinum]|uniref:ABC-2 type transport system permease protein n=1 Tax=Corynebacterium marinum DSM 44953 TaxID=1224162 RepID=A0A0B6TWM5_9CORY|nr:hypothetical protein [Corynebacterium marinum]AJK69151.1 hypothetical protein B840_07765 [Corynebacterium marinum DSM 44953]GGO17468.1 hypothetical protein GCM10010980_14690 [Corynebacterium marinum]
MSETTRLLLRLQRTLWVRTMKGNSAAWTMIALIGLYTILGMVSLAATVWLLEPADRWWGIVAVVGIGTLSYLAVSVVIPSGEALLRAGDFASLPLTARQLLPAMAWSTLLTSRGVTAVTATALTTVFTVVLLVDAGQPAAAALTVPVMAAALALTLLLGEVALGVSSGSGRVSSERSAVISGVLVMVMIFGFNLLMSYGVENIPLDRIGRILGWTPVGAAPAMVAAFIDADYLRALAHAGIAAATLVLGARWWLGTVARRLAAPLDAVRRDPAGEKGSGAEAAEAAVLLRGLPYTPAAVIYSRAVRYFRRDPRMLGSLVTYPVIAVVLLAQGILVDDSVLLVGMVVLALISGSLAVNDFGYDGPPLWLHIVSGVPARTVLVARHLASLTPMIVLLVLFDAAAVLLADNRGAALLVAAGSVGVVVSVAALALVLTAYNPFPTSRPGTSPWSDKAGFSGAAFVAAFASLLLGWIPSAPGGALLAFGYATDRTGLMLLGLAVSLAIPGALYWLGLRLSARRAEERMPEIYARVHHWVN